MIRLGVWEIIAFCDTKEQEEFFEKMAFEFIKNRKLEKYVDSDVVVSREKDKDRDNNKCWSLMFKLVDTEKTPAVFYVMTDNVPNHLNIID